MHDWMNMHAGYSRPNSELLTHFETGQPVSKHTGWPPSKTASDLYISVMSNPIYRVGNCAADMHGLIQVYSNANSR